MAVVNQNDRDIYYTNVEGNRTRSDRTSPSQGTPPRGQSTPSAGTDDHVFGDTAHGGVRDQRDATPETDTHSLDPSELTTNNMDTFVHAMTHPMPYGQPDKQGSISGLGAGPLEHDEIMDMYNSMSDTFAEHPEWGDTESFGEDKFMALAMVAANGGMGEDFDLEAYMAMPEADRDTALANGIANWIDDPQASGKETLTANIGVESMLGTQGGVRDILNIQSIDVLFGYEGDIHANTFFDQSLKADTLLAMDQILENLQEQGEITEDQYFDACESYDARMMNMAWCGNEAVERIAATDAMRANWDKDHPDMEPDDVLRDFCRDMQANYEPGTPEYESWDPDKYIESIHNPDLTNKDAYRSPLANGEWPDNIPEDKRDLYRDAYDLTLAEDINGSGKMPDGLTAEEKAVWQEQRQERAGDANSLLFTAFKAGIDAFRDVLNKSELGQKILMVCNNIVHTPPINGTMFQEVWDLDTRETNERPQVIRTPDPSPVPTVTPSITPSTEVSEPVSETTVSDPPVSDPVSETTISDPPTPDTIESEDTIDISDPPSVDNDIVSDPPTESVETPEVTPEVTDPNIVGADGIGDEKDVDYGDEQGVGGGTLVFGGESGQENGETVSPESGAHVLPNQGGGAGYFKPDVEAMQPGADAGLNPPVTEQAQQTTPDVTEQEAPADDEVEGGGSLMDSVVDNTDAQPEGNSGSGEEYQPANPELDSAPEDTTERGDHEAGEAEDESSKAGGDGFSFDM